MLRRLSSWAPAKAVGWSCVWPSWPPRRYDQQPNAATSHPTQLTPNPFQILGVLPLGTSMDYESATSREQGCWNPKQDLAPFLEKWSVPDENFVVDEVWRGMVAQLGFSGTVSAETLQFWNDTVRDVYSGDEGRKKLRMATINLMERDGLLRRLRDVKCPVYWLQVRIVYCRPEEDDW